MNKRINTLIGIVSLTFTTLSYAQLSPFDNTPIPSPDNMDHASTNTQYVTQEELQEAINNINTHIQYLTNENQSNSNLNANNNTNVGNNEIKTNISRVKINNKKLKRNENGYELN